MQLNDLIKELNTTEISGDLNVEITSVEYDSRKVTKGSLFVAVDGFATDGHKYIEGAVKNGAIAVLVSQELEKYLSDVVYIKVDDTIKGLQNLARWYRRQFNIPVVAVTGSVGKTTTKDMIYSVLQKKYNVLKTSGNLNSEIGVPMTVLGLNQTHQIAVIEMGMDHFGEIAETSSIVNPDSVVITNIGVAHLEYLKTRENILKAKCEVFENMEPATGLAILNADNDLLIKIDNQFKKIWYGKNKNADIRAQNVIVDYSNGVVKADIYIENTKYDLVVPGLSEHLVYAALSAIATGLRYNMTVEQTLQGVLNYTHTKMRMDIYKLRGDILLIDDAYNANPDSMKSLIDTVKKADKQNKILIIGDMFELGEDSNELHKQVIQYALESEITKVVVTGENMKQSSKAMQNDKIIVFDTKSQLIDNIEQVVQDNSIIAIKASRGMRFENITEKILEKYIVL